MDNDVSFDIPLKDNKRARVYVPKDGLVENIEEVIIWLQFLKGRLLEQNNSYQG